jgi:hypothetical protein
MIDQNLLDDKSNDIVEDLSKEQVLEHKSRLESTFDSLFNRLRTQLDTQQVDTQIQNTQTSDSQNSIEELIMNNPL